MTEIHLAPSDPQTRRLWDGVSELASLLPAEWVLIGGLMVQLHAFERGLDDLRLTRDIDVLGQTRPQGALAAIDAALRKHSFELVGPDPDGYAHRYERDDLIVDVLAPDGMSRAPALSSRLEAIGVPGGTQALAKSEVVNVRLDKHSFAIRRPTLLGAILIKARSLKVHRDPDSQREDLLTLLALVEDPRAMAGELTVAERRWLRAIETQVTDDTSRALDDALVRRAELALGLLLRAT
jgi:hypothetical protein